MARIYNDMWGNPQVGDLSSDIERAARDMKFKRDIGQVQDNFTSDMGHQMKQQAAILGVLGIIGSLLTARGIYRLVTDRAHRYRVQAKLHYLFAIIVSICAFSYIARAIDWLIGLGWVYTYQMPASVILVILGVKAGVRWTKIYIAQRIEPKMAALERGEEPPAMRSPLKKLKDAMYARTVRYLNHPNIMLTHDQARTGTITKVSLPGGRVVKVRIPAGVVDGQKLRIPSHDRRFDDAIATISLPKAR